MTSKKCSAALQKQKICYWLGMNEFIMVITSPEIHGKLKAKIV